MNSRLGILTFVVISGLTFCKAQNLVPNGSFEEYTACPGTFSQSPSEFRATSWHTVSLGTPDHFHSCSDGEADVPYNWAGKSEAYEGKGYAGIYLWMEDENEYREYLQCQLLQPLTKDSTYRIVFQYKLSSYSKFSIDRIGLVFTDTTLKMRYNHAIFRTPDLSVIRDSALTRETGLWETASFRYKASGDEKFLSIGNFFDNAATRSYQIITRPVAQEMLAKSAYYYIDDVKVVSWYLPPPGPLEQVLPEFSPEDARLNTTYVLKNILFELNSYRLVPPSFDELDKVAGYLLSHPRVVVQLFGHTDDQGSVPYNLKLSRDRAKNAGAYLTSVGINPNRIETFGYGKSKPLIKSTTPEARAINRRVEVKFIE
jgi:outer membrane protein OmpA-like peptidoglycan-associated protein